MTTSKQELVILLKQILTEIYPQGKSVRKGRIVKAYSTGSSNSSLSFAEQNHASAEQIPMQGGSWEGERSSHPSYKADVEILKNNDTPDENEPQINGVEIPVIWAGDNRGVICPPCVGSLCDIEYYSGDPNYPRISNFRPGSKLPEAQLDEFVLQQSPDTIFKIKADGSYVITGKNIKLTLTGDAEITAEGDVKIKAANATIIADKAVIKSDDVNLGAEGGQGLVMQSCVCQFTGAPHPTFTQKVKGV